MLERFWYAGHHCLLVAIGFFSTVDAYAWLGPELPDRTVTAVLCGSIASLVWMMIAKAFGRAAFA